jgi:hypothetical protein
LLPAAGLVAQALCTRRRPAIAGRLLPGCSLRTPARRPSPPSSRWLGGTRHPAAALTAYGLLTAVVAASTRPAAAAGVALIAWMFDNGFVAGRHADLSWHGAADARRLAILLAAAVAAAVLGSRIRRGQEPPPAPEPVTAVDPGRDIPDGTRSPPPMPRPPPHPPSPPRPAISQTMAARSSRAPARLHESR